MYNPLGFSLYLSTFEETKDQLLAPEDGETLVFTSLHIAEEMDEDYISKTEKMIGFLKDNNYRIIADVSKRSLEAFNVKTLEELRKKRILIY